MPYPIDCSTYIVYSDHLPVNIESQTVQCASTRVIPFTFELTGNKFRGRKGSAHPLHARLKGAREDEAVDALLQARDGHDLHKVALHRTQQRSIAHALVLWVLSLRMTTPKRSVQIL